MGKLTQSIVHHARVVTVDGNFDDALRLVREAADSGAPVAVVNSINPHRIEGQKTAAFEIVDDLGEAPDAHLLPSATRGTSPRTGGATGSSTRWAAPGSCRAWSASRRRGRHPFSMIG